jgi:hypothetical protein
VGEKPEASGGGRTPPAEGAPLLTVRPSPPRLWFSVASLGALGALMLWIALAHPPAEFGWRVFLLLGGGGIGWGAWRLVSLQDRALVLTEAALIDTRHGEICRIAEIAQINRGVFAVKPARGFALTLAARRPRHWVPGLWWRFGRSIGVGGMTGAAETKLMAEMIEAMVAVRSAR